MMNRLCLPTLLLIAAVFPSQAQDGFCMVNGTTSGGAGGPTVTVTNGTDFGTQIGMAGARIIQVQGPITIGTAYCASDKSIIGLGTNAGLLGHLKQGSCSQSAGGCRGRRDRRRRHAAAVCP